MLNCAALAGSFVRGHPLDKVRQRRGRPTEKGSPSFCTKLSGHVVDYDLKAESSVDIGVGVTPSYNVDSMWLENQSSFSCELSKQNQEDTWKKDLRLT